MTNDMLDARIDMLLNDALTLVRDVVDGRKPSVEQAVALGALLAIVRILQGLLPPGLVVEVEEVPP